MPRSSRRLSQSGIYHVMLRGNEKKDIFAGDKQKVKFINTLMQKKKIAEFKLYAYCVMDNHVHLIIRECAGDTISDLVKRVATSYAQYYNKKHERVGHVFQDRFKSEPIEDEPYLLSAIRYVHNNPVKASICSVLEYPWSSAGLYAEPVTGMAKLPEIKEILEMFAPRISVAVEQYLEFCEFNNDNSFIDIADEHDFLVTMGNAKEFVQEFIKKNNVAREDLMSRDNAALRKKLITTLVEVSNLSGRQMADITGINRETVRKLMMSSEPSP